MSGSQEPRAALVSVQDQGTINQILETNLGESTEAENVELLMVTQQVLSRVAQYSQPVREIQQVCSHPAEMTALRNQITILRARVQPALPLCDHTYYETQLETLWNELAVARRTPQVEGTDDNIRQELDDMSRDVRDANTEAMSFRTQLANALSFAVLAAPKPSQRQKDRGHKFLVSPEFSRSDRTQLRGWTAQVRMIIRHKPNSFPNDQSKMRYAFNRLGTPSLRQILPHVREHREIDLGNLTGLIQLLEAAFGNPDRVATAERNMWEIK